MLAVPTAQLPLALSYIVLSCRDTGTAITGSDPFIHALSCILPPMLNYPGFVRSIPRRNTSFDVSLVMDLVVAWNLNSRCSSSKYPQKAIAVGKSSKDGVPPFLSVPFAWCWLSLSLNELSCSLGLCQQVSNINRSGHGWCTWLCQRSQHVSGSWTQGQSTCINDGWHTATTLIQWYEDASNSRQDQNHQMLLWYLGY